MARATNSITRAARLFWDERNLDALIELCSSPEGLRDPKARYYGGMAFHARNHKRQAIECWREAMRLHPSYAEPIRALAYELTEREDFIDAVDLFQHLIRLRKATPDDLTALGEIAVKQGRLAEARNMLEEALEAEPTNALTLVAMATANDHMRNREAALEYLRRAAATNALDLSDLQSDPVFHFLWDNRAFEEIVSGG